jgi:magnesium transporter
MARFFRSKAASLGRPPGALVFIGEHRMDRPVLRLISYDAATMEESELAGLDALTIEPGRVTWLNLYGLDDTALTSAIGARFGIHSLALEDVVNTTQRPTLVDFGDYIFVVVKMLRVADDDPDTILSEQLSLIVGPGWLLTFQERIGDVFGPVRERMRKAQGRIRSAGADYLAYALLDTVVDNYITIVERLGEGVEDVDEAVLDEADDVLERINDYKREMNYLRKAIRPAREAIGQLAKLDSDLVADPTLPFLRDLYGLAVQAGEAIDTYREMLTDALNTYRTAVGTRLNEVMKVLTVFAAVFIPLTFIAGVYGMNFDYVPELHLRYGYYILWAVMITVGGGLLLYFRRKGWL